MQQRCAYYCKNADLTRIHPGVAENPRHYKCQKCKTVHSIFDGEEFVMTMGGHKRITKHG